MRVRDQGPGITIVEAMVCAAVVALLAAIFIGPRL
jgi:Tfp pilus assembly protein PilE